MIVFDKSLFGTSNHLIYDDGFSWKDEVPEDAWVYGHPAHPYSIDEWLHMHDVKTSALVEEKYITMAKEMRIEHPPWQQLLGKDFINRFKDLSSELKSRLEESKNSEYEQHWRKIQEFLFSLHETKADIVRYSSLKAMNVSLPGFNVTTGSIQPVQYDRRTKTGRLRVTNGPSVLTLKSEYRNVLKDCRQIDFKNMEPRLLLAFLGREIEGDLYEKIANDLDMKGDRSYIKVSIISSLYGSRVVPQISEYFAINEWIVQLEKNVEDGWIKNYFGRPIKCENVRAHHLLSLWLQSSASDAALLAFADFFKKNTHLKPHWIIHDACIFSGNGSIPEYLSINDKIKLPIECTEIK